MEKVLIIGNGFDVDLGLATKYIDFCNSKYFQGIDKSSGLVKYLAERHEIDKWIDLELEIRNFILSGKVIGENNMPVVYDIDIVDKNKNGFFELNNVLMNYLKSLDYSAINHQSTAAKLLQAVGKNGYFKIYNYNYSDFSRISRLLGFNKLEYTHVHSSIKESSIILGIEDNIDIPKEYCFAIKSHSPNYRSSNIRYALEKADEVVFFGHSLGITDYHYFSDFFLNQSSNNGTPQKKKTIRIFTYDENSRLDILLQLREMNNRKTNELFGLNDFRIYCTSKKEDEDDINNYCKNLIENSLDKKSKTESC